MTENETALPTLVGSELIARLFDSCAPALALYARQLCDDPEAIVQQAFMKLAEQAKTPKEPVAWLYRTVRNEALMVSRAARRRKRREIEAAQIKSEWFQPPSNDAVDAQAVANAVASLPTDQREIVTAHIWGGLSFQAIGSIMGVSSSSTHRRYQEALETLRKGIGE